MVLFGASFGVLSQSAGFDPAGAIVMSATTFAGSAQFAVISVLGAGGTLLAAVAAAVLLNARYGPMGLAAAHTFTGGWLRRAIESQLLVDESWAVSQQDGRFDRRRMLGGGMRALRRLGGRHRSRRGAWAAGSATRLRSASMPPSRHCSWR